MIAIIPERDERADAPADVGPDLLRVAAITPFTTIDFPGKLSAVAGLSLALHLLPQSVDAAARL